MIVGVLFAAGCGPASAHRPHFSESGTVSAEGYPVVQIKLLRGDGIFFADPIRAVVIGQNGELLAASPLSRALHLFCHDGARRCRVYDDLTFKIYEPKADQWQAKGLIEQDGEPQQYPEDMDGDFGFSERQATLAEIIRFEAIGIVSSWGTTGFRLAWWSLFWLLLLSVVHDALGKTRRFTIGAIAGMLARTVGALLMIPVAAYGWLLEPYSLVYLGFVMLTAPVIAILILYWRRRPAA